MVERRKPKPTLQDDENPEWTDDDFARATPAAKLLPKLFGSKVAAEMLQPRRGRPPADRLKIVGQACQGSPNFPHPWSLKFPHPVEMRCCRLTA